MKNTLSTMGLGILSGLLALGGAGCKEEAAPASDAGSASDSAVLADAGTAAGDAGTSTDAASVDSATPVGGAFDCEAIEEVGEYTMMRDPRLTIGSRTARFSSIPACVGRTLGAEARYTELVNAGWIDAERIETDFLLQTGYVSAAVYSGSEALASGTFPVRAQPTSAEDALTMGVAGMIAIKPNPETSAMATPWVLGSGSVEVVDHGVNENVGRRCIELRFDNVGVSEQGGSGTATVNGSMACWL